MFTGEYSHSMDTKGRFIMPSKFREQLGACFMLTKGMDGCLFAYSMDEWQEVLARLGELSGNKKNIRDLKRFLLGGAIECEVDKQGRCLVAPNLREFAKIGDNIKIIGVGSKIEIWDSGIWDGYNSEENINPEFIAESIEFLNL